jgi:hypothetical protein
MVQAGQQKQNKNPVAHRIRMRIIFSRKGFDSAAGGCPSPIIDGRSISLPIPTRMPTRITYADLSDEIAQLVPDLTRGRIAASAPCHLDPDIDRALIKRHRSWRGALGQVSAAQSHLRNQRVAAGDIFLFWGLFQPVQRHNRWRFVGSREHRIYGWLQIGAILEVGANPKPALQKCPWLAQHPHLLPGWPNDNVVYVASQRLSVNGRRTQVAGSGVFTEGFRLTHPLGRTPSHWLVPEWLHPRFEGPGMTYHPPERWQRDGSLIAAARGQEFVADVGDDQRAIDWLEQLFEENA